jgi:hypothetical protein
MRIRYALAASLPLLLSLAAVAAAQTLDVPPIKMGLWQTESTTSISGVPDNPMGHAMAGAAGRSTVTQSCFTPETWTKGMQDARQRQHNAECSRSNLQQDSHKLTYDEVCTGQGGYSTNIHFEMLFDDAESAHGFMDMKTSGAAFPDGMTMHMNMKTKYLSSDCGSVKPGDGKIVHP